MKMKIPSYDHLAVLTHIRGLFGMNLVQQFQQILVLISGCRNVHPSATRSLTIREATRAQSFPDEFVFVGKWGDIRKAIGNAVPPILAKVIADSIMEQLF